MFIDLFFFATTRGYQLRGGRRYNPEHDRSLSPEPPGPRVFSEAIRRAMFLTLFRQPANLTKYSRVTNSELWLADYHLACQLGGADDDLLISRNLLLHLADLVRAWLEYLPERLIHSWADRLRSLLGTFRAHTCAPTTSGTSGAIIKSLTSPSGISSSVSPSNAPSSPTSLTPM